MAEGKSENVGTDLEKREVQLPEGVERTREGREFLPLADIYESKDVVVVTADMPGVDPSKVDVTLEGSVLTIRGGVEEQEPEGMSLGYREYLVGDFARSFSLSDEVDRDGIEANLSNGVLTLTLPKVGPRRKRIEVKGK